MTNTFFYFQIQYFPQVKNENFTFAPCLLFEFSQTN